MADHATPNRLPTPGPASATGRRGYVLEKQVGYLLRRAHQRATAIFMATMAEYQFTPTQFAALVKIGDEEAVSQNRLGRLTAMDPATMQGVVRRLRERGLIRLSADPNDRRRTVLRLSDEGRDAVERTIALGKQVTRKTLAPLDAAERREFLRLLEKLS